VKIHLVRAWRRPCAEGRGQGYGRNGTGK
jgi:hypothetical protein